MPDHLGHICRDYAEHFHDSWAMQKIDNGWVSGPVYDEDLKQHPSLKPYSKLHERVSSTIRYALLNPEKSSKEVKYKRIRGE